MSTNSSSFYGVDRNYIATITAKARRERAAVLRALVAGIFTSVTDKATNEKDTAGDRAIAQCKVAHL